MTIHGTGKATFKKSSHEKVSFKSPNPPSKHFYNFTSTSYLHIKFLASTVPYKNIEKCKSQSKTSTVCQSLDNVKGTLPTWGAANSLLVSEDVTKYQLLPLHSGAPTDWSNLYTSLKTVSRC